MRNWKQKQHLRNNARGQSWSEAERCPLRCKHCYADAELETESGQTATRGQVLEQRRKDALCYAGDVCLDAELKLKNSICGTMPEDNLGAKRKDVL